MSDYYKEVYEELYRAGYRNNDVNNGAAFLKHVLWYLSFKSFLDVGCSTGVGVQTVANENIISRGIDISETAIKLAKKRGRNCVVGSICGIPYMDNSYDMVFSSDVMEHLKEEDIDMALKELCRVSKKYVALVIALKKDKCISMRKWFFKCKLPDQNLHLSILSDKEWINKMKNLDMKIIYNKTTENKSRHLLIILEKKCQS